jgi:hypothetical protein
MAAPAGAKPVGPIGERRFVVGLQQQAHHLPDELVRPGRQSQRARLPVLFRDMHPPHRTKPVALVAHRIDDATDLAQRHAVDGFLGDPRAHRTLVGVDAPVGQQIQLRVEQLSIQLRARQTTLAALTQDTQNRFGALHYAYLPNWICPLHLTPFALQAAFPPSLAGRDSGDYYEASVAIGLAPDRRSHVRRCRTWQREVGVPLISLNALTGHRS